MPSKLKGLVITKVALVDEGACSAAHVKLFKRRSEGGQGVMNFDEVMKSLTEEERALVQAEIDKAKADLPEGAMSAEDKKALEEKLAASEGDLAKAKDEKAAVEEELNKAKQAGQQDEEELLKNVDPAVRALIEKQKARATAAEQAARTALDAQETQEALAKAKELPNISTDTDALAGIIKTLKTKAPEVLDPIMGVLKAANTAVENSLLNPIGSDGGSIPGDADKAWAEIEKAAAEIAKSSNISKEAAISKVVSTNTELYNKYLSTLE